jgi:phosphopantothenoylcysteine decarboxylase/phosphopantothenate--cysteine ligase
MQSSTITLLKDKSILLAVTGSIAAYKAVDLASKLTQAGAQVDVILTEAAQRFVTPLTFEAVTGRPAHTDMWASAHGGLPTHIAHIGLAEKAALLAVVPATADSIARLAHGFAADLLGVIALASRCPLLIAPAMDGSMYQHPAVQQNLAFLRERGAIVVQPEEGRFASGLYGLGRLPETPTLIGEIRRALGRGGPLRGAQIVVTAGGTREPIDPVRFITNRSSGKQGYALAQAALDAGAQVTLISAARGLPAPVGARLVQVDTAEQMHNAVMAASTSADVLVMAAAVSDFKPFAPAEQKIKKNEETDSPLILTLERTVDILSAVKERRRVTRWPRVVVGFAAESENLLENGQQKLERKGLDLLVANDIRAADAGFDVDTNRVVLLMAGAPPEQLDLMSKTAISELIMERLARLLEGRRSS